MRNTSKGDSIAYLSKILLVSPRQVVKIVMNFLRISQLKSDLPVPEIFDSFVKVLRDESIIEGTENYILVLNFYTSVFQNLTRRVKIVLNVFAIYLTIQGTEKMKGVVKVSHSW